MSRYWRGGLCLAIVGWVALKATLLLPGPCYRTMTLVFTGVEPAGCAWGDDGTLSVFNGGPVMENLVPVGILIVLMVATASVLGWYLTRRARRSVRFY